MDCGKVVGVIFFCDVAGSMGEVPLIRFLWWRWVGSRRLGRGCRGGGVPWVFELHRQGREEFVDGGLSRRRGGGRRGGKRECEGSTTGKMIAVENATGGGVNEG